MDSFESHLRRVIEYSLHNTPEEMLEKSLAILIEMSRASGGSILGEEGTALKFLFADKESLIGVHVPWDSIAGDAVRKGVIIYTYAPADERHFRGVDDKLERSTDYLLTMPIPAVHSSNQDSDNSRNAGALQLLFDSDIFPELDVTSGPQEFGLDAIRRHDTYTESLQEVFWILPNLALGMEVMKLRQMSYQAIHELKNKLISAQSWVNCLREDLEMTAPAALEDVDIQEDMDLASSAIREGSNLAVSYLQFTRIYNPEFVDTALNQVLSETAASLRAFASDQGSEDFKVETTFDDSIPERELDPSQLQMAFFNLGKNAAEALIGHGVEKPAIRMTTQAKDDKVVVTVADNGPGMPQDIAENLFVPFKTKKKGGTGLGLTITKKIIDIHQGDISCKTGEDGTTFTVVI